MWKKIRPNRTRERFARSLFGIVCALMAWAPSAQARTLRAAIFDFELIDTSLEGATNGPRADEAARLVRLGDQLRMLVMNSGKFEVIDIEPVRTEAHNTNLQACGGCDADLAQKLGAEVSITGTVQKVSNLILNVNLYARVVATREPLDDRFHETGIDETGSMELEGCLWIPRLRLAERGAVSWQDGVKRSRWR
jgi:hypothetical protein